MVTRYCFFCGHGPVDIVLNIAECSDCHARYALGKVIKKPNITEEEAETLFTKKELTERQRTGKSGSKRWKNKK